MEKNVLELRGKEIFYKEQKYEVEDLFTEEFYHFSDEQVQNYFFGEITDNIIFLNFVHKMLALYKFCLDHKVESFYIPKADKEWKHYVMDVKVLLGLEERGLRWEAGRAKDYFHMALSLGYLLWKQLWVRYCPIDVEQGSDVVFIRTKGAKSKIRPQKGRVLFEETKIGQGTLYQQIKFPERIALLVKSFWQGGRLYRRMRNQYEAAGMRGVAREAAGFYSRRLVHTFFYVNVIEAVLKQNSVTGNYITGNNLDAYALLEYQAAHDYGLKVVCIPHGLEYGFRFPQCFIGDMFYTTSQQAADFLNQLYETSKFIFDSNIALQMFQVKDIPQDGSKKVIYFTEPREPEVNLQILRGLYEYLSEAGIPLFVKHHPGDHLEQYQEFQGKIKTIENLSEALYGNICIARKSTVLLEGLYNHSSCAAILLNKKDCAVFHTFPSLCSASLRIFDSIEALGTWAVEEYGKSYTFD